MSDEVAEEAARLLKGITPGEWAWREDGDLIAPELYQRWVAGGHQKADWPIVLQANACHGGSAEIDAEREADAAFIAAAPRLVRGLLAERAQMRAALRQCDLMFRSGEEHDSDWFGEDEREVWTAVRSALNGAGQ